MSGRSSPCISWCGTHSVLYSLERELFPIVALGWLTPRRIRFCLDEDLPAGASHHQKIVVVDDAVAFCGGLDVTTRRWDTAEHRLDDARRVDPAGLPYRPFHDVQAVIDGRTINLDRVCPFEDIAQR